MAERNSLSRGCKDTGCDGFTTTVLIDPMLRVARKLLAAAASLLALPIVVNLLTGGTLASASTWMWLVVGACFLLTFALDLVKPSSSDHTILQRQDWRNVGRALDQVARYVDLRQRNSFAERVRIALSLDERPDVVQQPVHLVRRIGSGEFQVDAPGDIYAVFEELSGSMLILGAPGAGKSTQLLDLAEQLVVRARACRQQDPNAESLVPIVVDLVDWSRSGLGRRWLRGRPRSLSLPTLSAWLRLYPRSLRPRALIAWFRSWPHSSSPLALSAWLAIALRERYGISPLISASWLKEGRLILLLDGLDEVSEDYRSRCIEEVNQLQEVGIDQLVVCSRTTDYESIRGRLQLQGAVEIQPFPPEQVTAFLRSIAPQLHGVVEALAGDGELWELLTTPLMLNIMALAYGEGVRPAVHTEGDPQARRSLLFDAYVIEVLARRRTRTWRNSTEQTLFALRAVARFSVRLGSGVQVVRPSAFSSLGFSVVQARIQQGWLRSVAGTAAAIAVAALVASEVGLMPGLLMGLATWSIATRASPKSLIVAPQNRMGGGRWLLLLVWSILAVTAVYFPARLTIELAKWLLPADWAGVGTSLVVGLVAFPLWSAFVRSPGRRLPEQPRMCGPLIVQFVITAFCVFAACLIWSRPEPAAFWPLAPMVLGAVLGLYAAHRPIQWVGGVLSRWASMLAGELDPWRLGLLRFATDRSLLSFVGTEYRFVHLLVRDHLARCDPVALAEAVASRRNELDRRS